MANSRLSSSALRRPFMRGFSLVELMVAVTLSLILLGGVLAIFASSRKTYETNDRLSRIQESGRFALDSIVRDIRAAGYIGCSQRAPFINTLNNSTTVLWNFEFPMMGFDSQGDGTWSPTLDTSVLTDPLGDNDALVLRIPKHDNAGARVVTDMVDTTDSVEIDATAADSIDVNDIVMITDCNARAVFEVSGKAGGVLAHETTTPSASATPGNETDDISQAYTANAEVVPLRTVIYYIGAGGTPGTGTSLWRRISGMNAAEELVEGVENMQLLFGVRTGTTVDYMRADQVLPLTKWNDVVAVSVALLVRSLSEYGADVDNTTYAVLDENIEAPNDRNMRQVFTTTATIRNQTL